MDSASSKWLSATRNSDSYHARIIMCSKHWSEPREYLTLRRKVYVAGINCRTVQCDVVCTTQCIAALFIINIAKICAAISTESDRSEWLLYRVSECSMNTGYLMDTFNYSDLPIDLHPLEWGSRTMQPTKNDGQSFDRWVKLIITFACNLIVVL